MPRRQRGKVEIKIRLYPGQDDELIQWLVQFEGQPYGVKTRALKDALRFGIGGTTPETLAAAPASELAAIRSVVEAAVASAMDRWEGPWLGSGREGCRAEDDEVEGLLDAFEGSLVLGDD